MKQTQSLGFRKKRKKKLTKKKQRQNGMNGRCWIHLMAAGKWGFWGEIIKRMGAKLRQFIMYKHIAGLANTHERSWIPAVHSMVNTMRPVPVMREPRAVLITRGGSEDLCQSLGAHFIRAGNPTKSPLIYQFTSFPLALPASRLALLIHCGGSSPPFSYTPPQPPPLPTPPIFVAPISLALSSPLRFRCISLLIYVNPFAVRMKLV